MEWFLLMLTSQMNALVQLDPESRYLHGLRSCYIRVM